MVASVVVSPVADNHEAVRVRLQHFQHWRVALSALELGKYRSRVLTAITATGLFDAFDLVVLACVLVNTSAAHFLTHPASSTTHPHIGFLIPRTIRKGFMGGPQQDLVRQNHPIKGGGRYLYYLTIAPSRRQCFKA
ncbi:Uncharacterized membrane protein [Pseudomonas syringae pv. actinidiae]|uniref:Uncharacterized membrane protein n=1 Tax=Pseudomonas syringae pv. actinidiae TaxID=103796 RepID=A0AAN4Q6B6_PSESF|nr:Uncharacterized membrane protein [Pseudomonas syringae pv. actinidiae]